MKITDREHEILRLVAKGLLTQDIAEELYISEETVKTHIKNVYKKLGVHNRIEAINKYADHLNDAYYPFYRIS